MEKILKKCVCLYIVPVYVWHVCVIHTRALYISYIHIYIVYIIYEIQRHSWNNTDSWIKLGYLWIGTSFKKIIYPNNIYVNSTWPIEPLKVLRKYIFKNFYSLSSSYINLENVPKTHSLLGHSLRLHKQ